MATTQRAHPCTRRSAPVDSAHRRTPVGSASIAPPDFGTTATPHNTAAKPGRRLGHSCGPTARSRRFCDMSFMIERSGFCLRVVRFDHKRRGYNTPCFRCTSAIGRIGVSFWPNRHLLRDDLALDQLSYGVSRSEPSFSSRRCWISTALALASRSGRASYSETQHPYTRWTIASCPASL